MADDILKQELDELRKLVNKHEDRIKDSAVAKPIDKGIFLKYDEFSEQNPLKIIAHIEPNDEFPSGAKISWKNWKLREESVTWMGWTPFQLGDRYTGLSGELLKNYISSAPEHMIGQAKLDGYIRRGDLVLCRIDARIKEAREHNREMRSRIATQNVSMKDVQTIRSGTATAVIESSGMEIDVSPRGGHTIEDKRNFVAKPLEESLRTELLPQNRPTEE